MKLKLITGPAAEPVTLTEAKSQCRVDGTTEDTFITALIVAAREAAEGVLQRALINQTWELVLDAWPAGDRIELPRPPLSSVTSIKYTDIDAVEHTMSSSDYLVDTDSEPGKIVLKWSASWPSVTLREAAAIRVRFVAGYGSAAAAVPAKVKQAIQLLVGHYYENREGITSGAIPQQLPLGVMWLLWQDRHFA